MHAGRLARCCTVFECRQHALSRVYFLVLLSYADVVSKGKQIHVINLKPLCSISCHSPRPCLKADKSINDWARNSGETQWNLTMWLLEACETQLLNACLPISSSYLHVSAFSYQQRMTNSKSSVEKSQRLPLLNAISVYFRLWSLYRADTTYLPYFFWNLCISSHHMCTQTALWGKLTLNWCIFPFYMNCHKTSKP